MISLERSEIATLKLWKIIRKTYAEKVPFNTVAGIESTAYYWAALQMLRKERMF